MSKFTQQDCVKMGREIEAVLKDYANKNNITIWAKGGTFTPTGMNLGLEIVVGKGASRPQIPPVSPVAR